MDSRHYTGPTPDSIGDVDGWNACDDCAACACNCTDRCDDQCRCKGDCPAD